MKANIWKKNAVLATVILFVCVAVYLNWSYGRDVATDANGEVLATQQAVVSDEPKAGASVLGEDGLTKPETTGEGTKQTSTDYFAAARLNRQQARDGSLAILRESASITDASQEVLDAAVASLNAIAQDALSEAQIESLVIAKGFTDCVAYISDTGVDVVVEMDGGLKSEHVAQIRDIVISETGMSIDNITITEAK